MTTERLLARRAIEALRAGIATPSVASTLGTSQVEIEARVLTDLGKCAAGEAVAPLVIVGGFGSGKTHMLNHIAATAQDRGYVTSYVVASPETPPGNLHVVLKALAETARAPGYTGQALRELMAKYGAKSAGFGEVRRWASARSDIHERFVAMLQLYEEFSSDPEFQSKILADFEGKPMKKTEIRSKLKKIGQLQGYDLSHPKNKHLAPERLVILSQLYRACDCKGWVVLFDEMERLVWFPRKQRLEAYWAIGWWAQLARQGIGVYPIFAFTPGAVDDIWRKYQDHLHLDDTMGGLFAEQQDFARVGLELLAKERVPLINPTADQLQRTLYSLHQLYCKAYDWQEGDSRHMPQEGGFISVRSQVRRWITEWDLKRLYGSAGEVVDEGIVMDTRELSEDEIVSDDDEASAE
ncbi:MAG: hypothetical protein AMXMBFR61_22170 [Fimbriimonadales bacterium]